MAAAGAAASAATYKPIAGDGIFRFDLSEQARLRAAPSVSFSEPFVREEVWLPPASSPASPPSLSLSTSPQPSSAFSSQAATNLNNILLPPASAPNSQAGRDDNGARLPEEGGLTPLYIPQFSLAIDNAGLPLVYAVLRLPEDTSFYGTGEVAGRLLRNGTIVECWNSDVPGYKPDAPSLYQSHPWVLAVLPDGSAVGVLADTTLRCQVDLREPGVVAFSAAEEYPVVTIGPLSHPRLVVRALASLVGRPALPPLWSLGNHQCRWSYKSAERVLEVAREFRGRSIPCDAIWMDIDYMDGFRCFTFNPTTFPNPGGLYKALHELNVHAIWMLDPGIKADEGYFAYAGGSEQRIWVRAGKKAAINEGVGTEREAKEDQLAGFKPAWMKVQIGEAERKVERGDQTVKAERSEWQTDGTDEAPFRGDVWPGECVFPDFTSARAREWWAELVEKFVPGVCDGLWNDMNEPSVFNSITKTMPEDCVHQADPDLGGNGTHARYHNIFGMQMVRASREGLLKARPSNRPFILTRAGFVGYSRYAASWTGDNVSSWEHYHMSIPMVLNLGLSAQPFVGPDIGGFIGDCWPELYSAWIGLGSFLPFCRTHTETGSADQEPWSFGRQTESLARSALNIRYRLLPHLYTLFFSSHTTGEPVASPLFFADPSDPRLRNIDDAFLLGNLLVSTTPSPALPAGSWCELDFQKAFQIEVPAQDAKGGEEDLARSQLTITAERLPPPSQGGEEKDEDKGGQAGIGGEFQAGKEGGQDIRHDAPDNPMPTLLLKGGSILPLGPPMEYVGEKQLDPLTLLIHLDTNGSAEGQLYEDGGDGYDYLSGQFLLTTYSAVKGGGEVVVTVSRAEGALQRPHRQLVVRVLMDDGSVVVGEGLDGQSIAISLPLSVK